MEKEIRLSKEKCPYKRILLKFSGEALSGENGFGIDPQKAMQIAKEVKALKHDGVELAIVVGAGNLWRGQQGIELGMDRATADYMGMLATVMNAMALMDAIEKFDVPTRVMTAIKMDQVAEPYIRRRAISHLTKGQVVIFAGGTGNPFFTTDTAAALRAVEIEADIVIKATKVDGVYDKDPKKFADAVKYDKISFMDAIKKQVKVMDTTALTLCMENQLPILVLNFWEENALKDAFDGKDIGTLVSE